LFKVAFCVIINLYLTVYPHLMEGENQFNREQSTEYLQSENEYEFLDVNNNTSADTRSTKEKVTVAFVLITAFFAIILGVTQFSTSAKKPLNDLMALTANGDSISNEVSTVLAQQQKDTDGDGLSDYDELNVYSTSPYLADSDSDGISDKEEIDGGHDPNCPGSDTCFRVETGLSQDLSQADQTTLLNAQSDPTVLRELLLKNGFPKTQLDSITDEQLLSTYQQAIAGQNPTTDSGTGAVGTGNLGSLSLSELQNLTGAQIRQLMIDQGAPADTLAQVSDEQLRSMFLTKLNSPGN